MTEDKPRGARLTAAALDALRARPGLLPAAVARIRLDCSQTELMTLVLEGRLRALVLAGELHVLADEVMPLALELLETRTETLVAMVGPLARAMAGTLEEHEATGDYAAARATGAPLVCARRGAVHVRAGLEWHTVALPVSAVAAYIARRSEVDPEIGALPGGSALMDKLTLLEGVDAQQNVTPLHGDRRSHRVHGWVRVDPRRWSVRLPDALRAEVDTVTGHPTGGPVS